MSMKTSGHHFAGVAVLPGPAVVADALVGAHAVAVGAVLAARNVAVGTLPALLAVTFESVNTRAVVASWPKVIKLFMSVIYAFVCNKLFVIM